MDEGKLYDWLRRNGLKREKESDAGTVFSFRVEPGNIGLHVIRIDRRKMFMID